jgi:hypothetical protein
MHIQLLPPTLPPHRPLSQETPRVSLTPGMRVTAVVLSPDLEGRSMLAFAGRQLASDSPLPFPPGARVILEVVSVDADVPHMRVVPDETAMAAGAVATRTYGYAAAVLTAQGGLDPVAAAQSVLRWVPVLVARGVLTPQQAAALTGDLGRIRLPPPPPLAAETGPQTTEASSAAPAQVLADALAGRAAADPAGLEARLAAALRSHGGKTTAEDAVLTQSIRGRLAGLLAGLDGIEDAAAGEHVELAAARASIEQFQQALLSEQARVAAHYARDGVVVLRVPLEVGGQDVDVQLRVEEEAHADAEARGGSARRLRLDVDLATLGRVQAHLVADGREIRVELLTERPDAADALDHELTTLSSALTGAGFRDVLARVAIDPVRVTAGDPPLDLPPEGSIVSADA